MACLVQSTIDRDNSICSICQEGFHEAHARWTHVGGETHDPFHWECLKEWLSVNGICPLDRAPINLNSIFPSSERIVVRVKQAAIHIASTALNITVGSMAGIAIGGVLGTGVGGGISAILAGESALRRRVARDAGIATVGAVIAGTAATIGSNVIERIERTWIRATTGVEGFEAGATAGTLTAILTGITIAFTGFHFAADMMPE